MQKQRPQGIIIFVIWAVLMGGLVAAYGMSYLKEGMIGINSASTDYNPQLVQSWVPYFRYYMLAGLIWVLGGLGLWGASYGLLNSEEWGRKIGLYAGGAIVFGWAIIKFVSLSFKNPPPFFSLLVGMSALYLLTKEIRDYCGKQG
jgi:hypothetical protein